MLGVCLSHTAQHGHQQEKTKREISLKFVHVCCSQVTWTASGLPTLMGSGTSTVSRDLAPLYQGRPLRLVAVARFPNLVLFTATLWKRLRSERLTGKGRRRRSLHNVVFVVVSFACCVYIFCSCCWDFFYPHGKYWWLFSFFFWGRWRCGRVRTYLAWKKYFHGVVFCEFMWGWGWMGGLILCLVHNWNALDL